MHYTACTVKDSSCEFEERGVGKETDRLVNEGRRKLGLGRRGNRAATVWKD